MSSAGTARLTVAPGGYHFPAGVSVDFTPTPSATALDHTIMTAYQGYVLALWAAVASHGADGAYRRQAGGSAQSFTQREVAYFAGTRTVHGAITYSDVTVAGVYYGTSATVTACVDTSAFRVVDARTGAVTGPVFPTRYSHYLEEATAARQRGGEWLVENTAAYPASTSEGAVCR